MFTYVKAMLRMTTSIFTEVKCMCNERIMVYSSKQCVFNEHLDFAYETWVFVRARRGAKYVFFLYGPVYTGKTKRNNV